MHHETRVPNFLNQQEILDDKFMLGMGMGMGMDDNTARSFNKG